MSDQHYLVKVLGLSAIPRIVTFSLTSISFPLMVRALGADQYGIMVYILSITGFLEVFVGFGVSSAAGKRIAACRAERLDCLHYELRRWIRLQCAVSLAGILPVFVLGYLYVVMTGAREIHLLLFSVVAATMLVSVFVTFTRMILQATLSFRTAAILDMIDSVVRSAGWLTVAWKFHTVMALALAGLTGSMITVLVGGYFLLSILKKSVKSPDRSFADPHRTSDLPLRHMLTESWSFVCLTLGTRAFQTLPLVLIGRMLGFGAIGTIGVFTKIVEMVTLPFTVIGNALMVRAQEIKKNGMPIIKRYWDLLCRFAVCSTIVAGGFWIVVVDVATAILPKTSSASKIFSIMTVLILFRSISDLFAPASDYVGGLGRRMVFLLSTAVLQLPVIWVSGKILGEVGAVSAMVASYVFMVVGYIGIAKKVFFGRESYMPAKDIWMAVPIVAVSMTTAVLVTSGGKIGIVVYSLILSVFFLGIPLLRRQYASGRFMKFDLMREPSSV